MTLYTFYARNGSGESYVMGNLDIETQVYGGPFPERCKKIVDSVKTVDPTKEEDLFRSFEYGSRFWIAKGEPHLTGRPMREGEGDLPGVKRTPTLRLSKPNESNNS